MEIRGVVEGFYGPPYRWSDRFFLIKEFRNLNFNYYLYGPKEDPFHRKEWQKFYPEGELNKFKRLCNECRVRRITLNYALSPGAEVDLVVMKLNQLKKVGIREFSLFFDDIDAKPSITLAKMQAGIANAAMVRIKPRRLLVCPTQYSGKRSPYLETLSKLLDKRIYLLWTGPKIVSPKIARKDLSWLIGLFGNRIVLWDNYPVNDYDRSRIFLGPFRGRDPQILRILQGYLTNPMNEARTSIIPLFTLAEFFKKRGNYNPKEAITKSLKQFGLETRYSMLRQFFPSRIYTRISYETRLLKRGDFKILLDQLKSWQRFNLLDGQKWIDNLLLARDLLLEKLKDGYINQHKLRTLMISKQKDFYFENQVYHFLLTKNG